MQNRSVLIAVPINNEKLYCFRSFVAGLKKLIKSTVFDVTVAFAVNGADVGIIAAIKASGLKHWLLAAPRRRVSIPDSHVFESGRDHITNMTNITLARNILREAALIGGHDYLFFLDSDGCVEPETINKLAAYDLPVACCMHAQRLFGDSTPLEPQSIVTCHPDNLYWDDVKNKPSPINYAGFSFGATLIERTILERFPITFATKGNNVEWSEDYTFYRQIQNAGYKFCCDQHIKTLHMLDPKRFPNGWTNDNRVMTYSAFARGK